jgi:predicted metal-dependent peptidase
MDSTENTKSSKFENLLGETDPQQDAEVIEKLITARVNLLFKAPFFGNMAVRLKLTNADRWCSTAATDGRRFYYNSKFIDQLKSGEIEFLFGHEVLHACYDHMSRRDDRHPELFNIACDYAVNRDLVDHGVGELITSVPVLYDRQYGDMISEEIYDKLFDDIEQQMDSGCDGDGDGGAGGKGKIGKGNLDDLLDKMIDEHIAPSDDPESDKGDGNGPTQLTPEEREQIKNEIKDAMISSSAACEAGDTPLGVARLIKTLTNPKMDWRELLQQTLHSTIKADYSWMRPNRRNAYYDAIIPGMEPGTQIDIVVAIDTSGSISESMLRDFLSEISGIMETFTEFKIHLFTFDTQVYNPQFFTSENLKDITEYDIQGCGGTDFDCVFTHLAEEQVIPERLIFFTDGYPCGSWGDENLCETLFVIHGSTSIVAPFGLTAYYEES